MGRFKDAVASSMRASGISGYGFRHQPAAVSPDQPFGGSRTWIVVDEDGIGATQLAAAFPQYRWIDANEELGR